jgi:hypothetical protein
LVTQPQARTPGDAGPTALPVGALRTSVNHWLREVVEAELAMPAELSSLYRANGALFMAFDALATGDAQELRYWARQAVERWRAVVAGLPRLVALMRAARARLSARHAWDGWTDEDRAVEGDAWRALG